MYWNLNKSK